MRTTESDHPQPTAWYKLILVKKEVLPKLPSGPDSSPLVHRLHVLRVQIYGWGECSSSCPQLADGSNPNLMTGHWGTERFTWSVSHTQENTICSLALTGWGCGCSTVEPPPPLPGLKAVATDPAFPNLLQQKQYIVFTLFDTLKYVTDG